MSTPSIWLKAFWHCARTINCVLFDLAVLLLSAAKSRTALVAENLFLRKQLAMFQERHLRPHRAEDRARWLMAHLSRLFDWRGALVVVKPDTLNRWHRKGIPLVLALEIQAGRKTCCSQESPGVDPKDGG
jgi:putative transposase